MGSPNKDVSGAKGAIGGFSDNLATLMVARTTNKDEDCDPADRSLFVKGTSHLEGDTGTAAALDITSFSTFGCRINGSPRPLDINGGTVWVDAQG